MSDLFPNCGSEREMSAAVVVQAPVRLSFGGGGTDLAAYYEPHGGLVLSAAITRYCYVVAREPAGGGIRISSANYGIQLEFDPGVIPAVEEPLSLPRAAIEWFADHGLHEKGVDLLLSSDVPPGTGLGSSSAMTVALVRALSAYLGLPIDKAGMAETACRIEIERLGMPIGKQDQYASAYGGLNTITFTVDSVSVEPVALSGDVVRQLADRLLLFSSGRSRHSSHILRQQRADSLVRPGVIDSLHHLKTLAGELRAALLAADFDSFGHLLDEGWQYKKRLSARISSGDIDRWYGAARAAGALGGKITGAGGGGFLLLCAPPACRESVRVAMTGYGLQEMTFDFDLDGAREGGSLLQSERPHRTGRNRRAASSPDASVPAEWAALQGSGVTRQLTERWPDLTVPIAPLAHTHREEGNHA